MRRHGLLALAAHAVVTAIVTASAYWEIFSKDPVAWDDEGFLLISLRSFMDGHRLYGDVFTQYGPFYYELWGGLLGLIGQPVSIDGGRLIVVTLWAATALLCGAAVYRFTRSLGSSVIAQVVTAWVLNHLATEPMHPGSLLVFLVAASMLAATFLDLRPRVAAGVMGALAGAALMTKVNVGGFLVLGAMLAAVATMPVLGGRPLLRPAFLALIVASPFLVMLTDLGLVSRQRYAGAVAAGLAAIVATAPWSGCVGWPRLLQRSVAIAYVAVAAAVAALSVLVIVLLGTTPSEIVDGVLIQPIHLGKIFSVDLDPVAATALPFVGLAAALALRALRGRVTIGPQTLAAIGSLRIPAGLLALFSMSGLGPFEGGRAVTLFTPIAVAWLVTLPPSGAAPSSVDPLVRAVLPSLAVLQGLHAYPVAGSQVGFSQTGLVVTSAIVLAEGLTDLRAWVAWREGPARRLWAPVPAILLAGLCTLFLWFLAVSPMELRRTIYDVEVALPFAGATRVHMSKEEAQKYVTLAAWTKQFCTSLITYPGWNTFHILADQPPPTARNTGPWFTLLDEHDQQRIVDAVKDDLTACLLKRPELIDFWLRNKPVPQRALVRFLDERFVKVAYIGDVDLYVRIDRPPDRGHSR